MSYHHPRVEKILPGTCRLCGRRVEMLEIYLFKARKSEVVSVLRSARESLPSLHHFLFSICFLVCIDGSDMPLI